MLTFDYILKWATCIPHAQIKKATGRNCLDFTHTSSLPLPIFLLHYLNLMHLNRLIRIGANPIRSETHGAFYSCQHRSNSPDSLCFNSKVEFELMHTDHSTSRPLGTQVKPFKVNFFSNRGTD